MTWQFHCRLDTLKRHMYFLGYNLIYCAVPTTLSPGPFPVFQCCTLKSWEWAWEQGYYTYGRWTFPVGPWRWCRRRGQETDSRYLWTNTHIKLQSIRQMTSIPHDTIHTVENCRGVWPHQSVWWPITALPMWITTIPNHCWSGHITFQPLDSLRNIHICHCTCVTGAMSANTARRYTGSGHTNQLHDWK